MANTGTITSILIIVVVINILAVVFSGTLGTPTVGDYVVYQMFSKDEFQNNVVTDFKADFQEGFDKTQTDETQVGSIISIFDGLKKVFSFFITILSLGFALFFQMQMTGAPFILCILIGLPVALGFYLGIISAIRGFSI